MLVGSQKMGYRTHRASWGILDIVGPQKRGYRTHRAIDGSQKTHPASWVSKKGV